MARYRDDQDQQDIERQVLLDQLGRPTTQKPPAQTYGYAAPRAGMDLSQGENIGTRKALGGVASGAATGAEIGSVVPGLGTAAGALGGAVVGGIKGLVGARSNDTKKEREAFAQSLGLNDTTALWDYLGKNLDPTAANELRDRALNRIGRHDMGADQQWMNDVNSALDYAKSHPPTASTSGAQTQPQGDSLTSTPAPTGMTPVTDYGKTIGQYTGPKYFGAYNEDKFNDPTHDSPKYQVLRTLSHFDPSKGVTDEVLAALNSLNLGTFARNGGSNGTGDKVTLTNGSPEWDGMTGADLITDFGGKNQWGVGGEFPGQKNGAPTGGQSAAPGFSMSSSLIPGLMDQSTYQNLLQRVQAILGPQSVDRDVLLNMLGNK